MKFQAPAIGKGLDAFRHFMLLGTLETYLIKLSMILEIKIKFQ